MTEICKHCQSPISGKFCSNCGQAVELKRINGHYIIHEIEHVLHFERGILYTLRELLLRPGKSVRHFISENRNRLVKPIIFIIISSLIYTLTIHFFHIEDGYMKFDGDENSAISKIFTWINNNYGYANILMGTFIAFWTKLFFKKHGYNFFEIIILLCFILGMSMLFYALFALFKGITHIDLMQVGGVIGFVYTTWAIGQFFEEKKFISYLKAVAANILGFLSFTLGALGIGILIDLVLK